MDRLSCYSAGFTGKSSRVIVSSITCVILVVLPSCGIPRLSRAKKGPSLPDSFNGEVSEESSAQVAWCEFFDDPALVSLINQALVGNQELNSLAQEVQIACYEVQARKGEYLPFVRFRAGAGIEKSSRFTREGAVEDQLEGAPGRGFPEPLPDFLIASDVSWEIDIWKKLRNAKNAAAFRYLGTRDGWNYVVTRFIAEVAENYYELLALDSRLETLDRTIEIQQKSLDAAIAIKEAGRGTELAVQRFEAEVRKNQSERQIIQQEIIEVENRLNVLAGRFPQPVERPTVDYIELSLDALSVGVPSQLLQNRADIRQAERELAAAGLDVQVARARFFPSLELSAGVGYQAFNTRYLFTSPESLIYNAAGELVAPLINKKAIRADYLTANAVQLQKVYDYQRTILDAYTEVINRLSRVENYTQSIEIKKRQLESLEAAVDSATLLFQTANVEYLEVLLTQRELMEAKMDLIDIKQQQLVATVNAYQALGGGYVSYDQLQGHGITCFTSSDAEDTSLDQPDEVEPSNEPIPTPEASAATPFEPPRSEPESSIPDAHELFEADQTSRRTLSLVEPLSDVAN